MAYTTTHKYIGRSTYNIYSPGSEEAIMELDNACRLRILSSLLENDEKKNQITKKKVKWKRSIGM